MQKHVRTCKNSKNHVFFRTLLHQKSTHFVHPWTRWLRNWWVSTCFSSKNHHKWLNLGKAMKQAAGLWDEKTIQAEFHHPTWPWKAMGTCPRKPWWPRVVQVFFSVHLEIWENREKCNLATRWWIVIMIGCHFFCWNHTQEKWIWFFVQSQCCEMRNTFLLSSFLLLGGKPSFQLHNAAWFAISNTVGGCECNDSSLKWNSKTMILRFTSKMESMFTSKVAPTVLMWASIGSNKSVIICHLLVKSQHL